MVDHIKRTDSLTECEKNDLENIAESMSELVIYMLNKAIDDLYVKECCTKVRISILNNKYISKDMTVYNKFPDFSIVYYVTY